MKQLHFHDCIKLNPAAAKEILILKWREVRDFLLPDTVNGVGLSTQKIVE